MAEKFTIKWKFLLLSTLLAWSTVMYIVVSTLLPLLRASSSSKSCQGPEFSYAISTALPYHVL